MKKLIVVAALLLALGMAAAQFSAAHKAQGDLANRMEQQLSAVNDTSLKAVAQNVRDEARKLGIELAENDVTVSYRNSSQQTVSQKYVSRPLHAQFGNKEAVIEVRYTARILGIPFKQEIQRRRLHQVQVNRPDPNSELNQVLDGTP
jgi:hypothetical protein